MLANGGHEAEQSVYGGRGRGAAGLRPQPRGCFRPERFEREGPVPLLQPGGEQMEPRRRPRVLRPLVRQQAAVVEEGVRLGRLLRVLRLHRPGSLRQMPEGRVPYVVLYRRGSPSSGCEALKLSCVYIVLYYTIVLFQLAGDEREDGSVEDREDSGQVQPRRAEPGHERLPRHGHRPQRLRAGLHDRELPVCQLLVNDR